MQTSIKISFKMLTCTKNVCQNLKMQMNLEINENFVNFGCAVAFSIKNVFVRKYRFHK